MYPTPNNSPAATTDYNTAIGEVAAIYDPQIQQVQQQQQQAQQAHDTAVQQLTQNRDTTLSSLDQAKANAFKTNVNTSNARGIFFSGYAPATNQAYVSNVYNPNVDKTNTTYQRGVQSADTTLQNNQLSLQDKINQINQERANAANTVVLNTQQAQQAAADKAAKAAQTLSDKANSANYIQGSQGQYMFVGANGKALNLQQYVNNTGGDINTVLGLLQNGTSYDKNIYNKVVAARPGNATAAINLIRELDTKKAYGF